MKQCIDSKQLRELNPNQFRRLCVLIGDKYYYDMTDERIYKCFQNEYLAVFISILEKTNIGTMIEILYQNNLEVYIDYDYQVKKWFVEIKFNDQLEFKDWKEDNLCDALWEGTKEFL